VLLPWLQFTAAEAVKLSYIKMHADILYTTLHFRQVAALAMPKPELPSEKTSPEMPDAVPQDDIHSLVPRCSKMFQDVPRCSKMFHDVPRCSNNHKEFHSVSPVVKRIEF
jgi:hypothetical protein